VLLISSAIIPGQVMAYVQAIVGFVARGHRQDYPLVPASNPTCQSSAVVICGTSDSSPADEPSEQLARRLAGNVHCQQENAAPIGIL